MRLQDWLEQGENRVAAGIAGVAALSGVLTALYLQLPGYLAEPIARYEPQYIDADDPGLAKYKEVVASLGGVGATFIVPAAFWSNPAADPIPARFMADTDRLIAEIEAQVRESERRVAWRTADEEPRARWSQAGWGQPEPDPVERYEIRRDRAWPDREPRYAAEQRAEWRREPSYERYREPGYERYREPAYEPDRETVTSGRGYYEPTPPPPPVPSMRWEPAREPWRGG